MNPFIPCPFTYGDIPGGGEVAIINIASRDPTVSDLLASGSLWLSDLFQGGTGTLFVQEGNVAGVPTWVTLSAGVAGALNTLSDGSTSVSPSAGNIGLVGTANQVQVFSNAGLNRLEFSLPANIITPGTLTVTGLLTMSGGFTATAGTFTTSLTATGTVLLNATGNGDTTIGNIAGSGFVSIAVGSGNFALIGGAHTVGIADDAAANILTIGSLTGAASTTIRAGTGNLLLTGATTTTITVGNSTQTGPLTFGLSTAGQNINIGSAANTVAQTITIGNGASAAASVVSILSGTGTASTAQLNLGNNPRLTVAGLGDVVPVASRNITVGGGTIITAVTDTIDIGPDGATTNASASKVVNVNTGGVTLGSVLTNIATGAVTSGTHTTAIATGNRAAGTMVVNLLTGTGTKALNVGNADGLTTTTILGPLVITPGAGNFDVTTTGAISLDAGTASNFTVTGAGQDLTLSSVDGSVLIESTENAALAIRLHANGGTSETIQIHADQGTGVASIGLLSDVGGITLRSAAFASADAVNIESVLGGVDIDAALQINVTSTQAAADAIRLLSTAGGIDIDAVGGAALDINITNTGGSIGIVATEAAADAIVINASNAAGGIDILTGGGQIDIGDNAVAQTANFNTGAAAKTTVIGSLTTTSTTTIQSGTGGIALSSGATTPGLVSVAPSTDTQASPTAASTINSRVGTIVFTGFTTAAAAAQVFTITNSLVSATSAIFVTVSNLGANDAQMTVTRVFPAAGSFTVTATNNGAAALNGNLRVNFWVIN